MAQAPRDENRVTTLLGVSSSDGTTPVTLYADPTTHRLLTSASGGAAPSDATYVVISANATLTDERILTGTANQITITDNGAGSTVVLSLPQSIATSSTPTFASLTLSAASSLTLGTASTNAGAILLKNATNANTATIVSGVTSASYSVTWPTAQASGTQVLQNNGSGVLSWATVTSSPGGSDTQVQYNNAGAFGGITGATTNGTALTLVAPVLGTPASGTLTNCTGLPISTGVSGLGANVATFLATPSSANLAAAVTDETGSGSLVFANTPTLVTPVLGVATATSINGLTITSSTGTLTVTNGKTLSASNTMTLAAGADGQTWTFPASSDTVVTLAATQELDNKTLDSSVGKGTWTASGTWTLPAVTAGGTVTLAENSSIALDPAGSADGKYTGVTITGTAGATLAFGDIIYKDPTDSRWELADANAAAAADGDARGTIGVCVLAAAADGDPTVILLMGVVRADAAFPALTINSQVFVSETAGDITHTKPTTTDAVVRCLGSALTADEILFMPSSDFYTAV